ncbi:MAG: hypothetical protein NVS9B9_06260 [Ktedonobacteraceae bacterium]
MNNTHVGTDVSRPLIIFDLDGVITSEEAYWDTAGLVIHELLYSSRYWNIENMTTAYHPVAVADASRASSRSILPEAVIVGFKSRAINSNWDTCYCGFCLYLIHLLALVPYREALFPLRPADDDWIAAFRAQLATIGDKNIHDTQILDVINGPVFYGYSGLELIKRFDVYASQVLGIPVEDVFARYSPSWWFCEHLFQEWYLGDELYTRDYGHAPVQAGKRGCIHFEEPLLPVEYIRSTLEKLQQQGYTLGIATGRPGQEALVPLENYGLLSYFDTRHITTHDEIAKAETELAAQGKPTSLVKPHPYQFLLAADPEYVHSSYSQKLQSCLIVGDTPSDIQGGHTAGAITIAVLTGAKTPQARTILERSGPDFLIADVTHLPALVQEIDSLVTIQRLQFNEREKAEHLLQRWFALHMDLQVESITLTPKAVSLNSFNGFYRANGEEYFFKTHVEEQGILEEYYHAEVLRQAGYNIVKPVRTVHEHGQQMVIYPVVRLPVMFDLVHSIETQQVTDVMVETLVSAEKRECERLLALYTRTLAYSTAGEHARAPIHQLFWHRLTGERLKNYYRNKSVLLPTKEGSIPFDILQSHKWRINGVDQRYTLGELIERATTVLNPARALFTIIGHGDAHFGNVFLENNEDYLYFDPAFAGRHSPLLDVVKPLFHNVFATWMYFPVETAQHLHIIVDVDAATIVVNHNYMVTPIRQAILQTKEKYLLQPLLADLRSRNALPDDWLEIMQSALLCCPLLTMNLIDPERMPPSIGWLGFALAIFMGNNSITSWRIEGK